VNKVMGRLEDRVAFTSSPCPQGKVDSVDESTEIEETNFFMIHEKK
jgi:hypothetical protein